jgi:Ca-activated chloride channel family protein
MSFHTGRAWTLSILLIVVLICPVFADGLIIIPRPPYISPPRPFNPFPLQVVYHHVDVQIDDQVATTRIDQAFYNDSDRQLEGIYLFPVPKGAVINNFSMSINGQQQSAELLDAEAAKKYYLDIVRSMRDPALLEYSQQGVFKVRIFPIEPHKQKKVIISYREILHQDNGITEYLYPLNTEKFSAKPLKKVSIRVNIQSKHELGTIQCPTHDIDLVRKGPDHALLSFEKDHIKPDIDFKLYFDHRDQDIGLSLLSYKKSSEDGFFFLTVTPALNINGNEIQPKDITFVLDVSGSMAGKKLEQAKKALNYCVDNLNDSDRFQIIRFSTEAYGLFNDPVNVNEQAKNEAFDFISALHPVGGTNIEHALQLALASEDESGRPHLIIFVTDGKPTIGLTDEAELLEKIKKSNTKSQRIFTFGIGDEINTHLLDKITELTHAGRSYISPSEDIELKIQQFYDKVRSPVLTDVSLVFDSPARPYQMHPFPLPDLFLGTNLTILGRYRKGGEGEVILSGKYKGTDRSFHYRVNLEKNNRQHDFIPVLWASRRVGYLLDLIRLHGEELELVQEVTDLARTYGIVTPYTSYLIMEDERIRVARNELPRRYQMFMPEEASGPEISERFRQEYTAMETKSGRASIQASQEVAALNKADKVAHTRQGQERLDYKDKNGKTQNISQQVRQVLGRAIYQNNGVWIDSYLQKNNVTQDSVRIAFASKAYFDLVQKNPDVAPLLALGQNVRFYFDAKIYEIY